mgnify:CR=1 FL=1
MPWSLRCSRCQSPWCPKDKCEARHDVLYEGDRARFVDFKHPKNGEIVEILSGGRVFTHARIRFADSSTHVTELHYHLFKIIDRKCVSSPNTDDSDSESESDSESDSDSDDEDESVDGSKSNEVVEIENFENREEYEYSSCNGKGCQVGPDMCDECRMDYAEYLAD